MENVAGKLCLSNCRMGVYARAMKPIGGLELAQTHASSPLFNRSRAVLVLCACVMTSAGFSPMPAADLRAGLAKTDITPSQPVKLAGYASRKDLSQGVHDPLGARALALEHDGKHLVFVSIDSIGFYNNTAEPLRNAVLEQCHLEPSELFLCAIHTHSAPALSLDAEMSSPANVEYTRTLRGKLVEVVRKALDGSGPIQLSVGFGSSPVGVNRREVVPESAGKSKIVLGRNPWASTDREVQVLRLVRPGEDKLAGVLFAYATHSTSLGAKNYLISGDIHGLAEQFLERYFGNNVVAPGFAGASGNIDPWVRVLPDFRTKNGWVPEPVLMGTMLAEEVARVLEGPQNSITNTGLKTRMRTVALPGKENGEGQSGTRPTTPFNVTVGQVGDIAFVGWGGEVFNEVGKAVKAGSPFRHTFILTHCNGAAGYVPIRTSYPEGGYEVESSRFDAGADEVLAEETLKMLKELHDSSG